MSEIHIEGRSCAHVTRCNMALIFLFRFALHAAIVLAFARWRTVPVSWAVTTFVLVFVVPNIEAHLSPVFHRLGLWRIAHEEK